MKKIVCILCVSVLLVMMALSACGGPKLNGTYRLVQIESGGQDYSAMLGSVEVYMTIEDNQATLNFGEQTMVWEVDTKAGIMRNESGNESPYRVEGNQMILENEEGGSTAMMVFERVESTPDSK